MAMKKSVKLGLLVLVMLGLVFTVSCAKRTPGPEQQPAAGEEQMGTTGQAGGGMEAGEQQGAAIGEENLEAQRAAQKRAEEQKKAEAAKAEFVNTKIYFAFDDASLDAQAREKLREQAQWLMENPMPTVIIEGHADSRGTDEYNLALGSRRAESVKNFLTKVGVPASRLITISYGEEQPAVQGNTEDAWTKNRRVEFRIR